MGMSPRRKEVRGSRRKREPRTCPADIFRGHVPQRNVFSHGHVPQRNTFFRGHVPRRNTFFRGEGRSLCGRSGRWSPQVLGSAGGCRRDWKMMFRVDFTKNVGEGSCILLYLNIRLPTHTIMPQASNSFTFKLLFSFETQEPQKTVTSNGHLHTNFLSTLMLTTMIQNKSLLFNQQQ